MKIIGGAILIVVATIFILKSCGSNDVVSKEQYQQVVNERDSVIKREREGFAIIDSFANENKKLDSAKQVAEVKQDVALQELNKAQSKVSVLVRQVRIAQGKKDTVAIVVSCDSLATIVEAQNEYIQSYERYTADVAEITGKQMATKDSIIYQQARLYSELRTSFNKVSENYFALFENYSAEAAKNKKHKKLTKILGAAVIVVGGALILK